MTWDVWMWCDIKPTSLSYNISPSILSLMWSTSEIFKRWCCCCAVDKDDAEEDDGRVCVSWWSLSPLPNHPFNHSPITPRKGIWPRDEMEKMRKRETTVRRGWDTINWEMGEERREEVWDKVKMVEMRWKSFLMAMGSISISSSSSLSSFFSSFSFWSLSSPPCPFFFLSQSSSSSSLFFSLITMVEEYRSNMVGWWSRYIIMVPSTWITAENWVKKEVKKSENGENMRWIWGEYEVKLCEKDDNPPSVKEGCGSERAVPIPHSSPWHHDINKMNPSSHNHHLFSSNLVCFWLQMNGGCIQDTMFDGMKRRRRGGGWISMTTTTQHTTTWTSFNSKSQDHIPWKFHWNQRVTKLWERWGIGSALFLPSSHHLEQKKMKKKMGGERGGGVEGMAIWPPLHFSNWCKSFQPRLHR